MRAYLGAGRGVGGGSVKRNPSVRLPPKHKDFVRGEKRRHHPAAVVLPNHRCQSLPNPSEFKNQPSTSLGPAHLSPCRLELAGSIQSAPRVVSAYAWSASSVLSWVATAARCHVVLYTAAQCCVQLLHTDPLRAPWRGPNSHSDRLSPCHRPTLLHVSRFPVLIPTSAPAHHVPARRDGSKQPRQATHSRARSCNSPTHLFDCRYRALRCRGDTSHEGGPAHKPESL